MSPAHDKVSRSQSSPDGSSCLSQGIATLSSQVLNTLHSRSSCHLISDRARFCRQSGSKIWHVGLRSLRIRGLKRSALEQSKASIRQSGTSIKNEGNPRGAGHLVILFTSISRPLSRPYMACWAQMLHGSTPLGPRDHVRVRLKEDMEQTYVQKRVVSIRRFGHSTGWTALYDPIEPWDAYFSPMVRLIGPPEGRSAGAKITTNEHLEKMHSITGSPTREL